MRSRLVALVKAVLSTRARKKLKRGSFALPGRRYPIEDRAHAANALSRVSAYGSPSEKKRVRAAVSRAGYKFPSLKRKRGMRKAEATHVITDAEVTRIALCRRGKNGFRAMLKSDDGAVEIQALVKAAAVAETGELLAVAYAPGKPDSDGWVADRAIVREMSRAFMRNGAEVDIEHDGEVLSPEAAYVSETFIVQKSDPRFQGWKTYDGRPAGDLTGAWAVAIQIDDPALREACEQDLINGVSVFGRAAVEPLQKSSAAEDDDQEMNRKQFSRLVKAVAEALAAEPQAAEIETGLDQELDLDALETDEEPAEIQAPQFEGDVDDPEALAAFEKAVRNYEFRKALASGELTADKIAEMRKSLTESEPSDEEVGVEPDDTDEVKKLRRRLHKAQRKSNAPATAGEAESAEVELAKSAEEIGKRIAARHNSAVGGSYRLVPKS